MPIVTRPKIQHRWLVPPDRQAQFHSLPATHISQAFWGPNLGMCARITDGSTADLTRTIGHGLMRFTTSPEEISVSAARLMFAGSQGRIISMFRRHYDGMKLDDLAPPFDRVMVAEFEKDDPEAPVIMPPWLEGAPEVTSFLSKRALADAARHLDEGRTISYEHVMRRVLSVAVTGGPCSGKTKLRKMLMAEFGERSLVHFVKEVATDVIEGGVDVPKDPCENRIFQGGVYDIQRSFEALAELQSRLAGKHLILTDRGTYDGCAYFAGGKAEFCRVIDTTEAEEYARYHRVVMLAPPPRAVWDELKASNDPNLWNMQRHETYDQAVALSELTRESWARHPDFRYIEGRDWPEKVANAKRAIFEGIINL